MSVKITSHKFVQRALALVSVLFFAIAFQNCGSLKSNTEFSNAPTDIELPPDDTTNPVPPPAIPPKVPTVNCLHEGVNYQCATIKYGDHPLQDYQIRLPNVAHASGVSPMVIYIHGGGFYEGDKMDIFGRFQAAFSKNFLDAGYAFASVNYRLSEDVYFEKGVTGNYPPPMLDGAAALQDIKMRASQYGYSADKIALTGISAGAGIAMWLAFHDDLKNDNSSVARERYSSRVSCAALSDTQTTYNLAEIKALLQTPTYEGVGMPLFYGFTQDEYNANPDYYQTRYASSMLEASAITHISADDNVKFLLTFMRGYDEKNIHSPEFGDYLMNGNPPALATQYQRNSLSDFPNFDFEYMYDQGTIQKNNLNIINFIKSKCF